MICDRDFIQFFDAKSGAAISPKFSGRFEHWCRVMSIVFKT